MSRLPPSASVVAPSQGAMLFAPSATRNVDAIVTLLRSVAPPRGRALEIASGTGQHIVAIAHAVPRMHWHPTEIAADRIASINAYATQANASNLHPAQMLDATRTGWATQHAPYDLIHLSNLLHLISGSATKALISEAAKALAPEGQFILYGPFMRAGTLTSQGDAKFHAELRAADPAIGYKDDAWIKQTLQHVGLTLSAVRDMPANNLAFIARRETG